MEWSDLRIFLAIARAGTLAAAARSLGQTQLRVTSSDWFGAHVLAPVFAEFTRAHPRVTLELLTDARLLSLSRREAEVAFRIQPFDEPDIVSRRLLRMRYGLYAQKGMQRPTAGDGSGALLVTMDVAFGGMPDVEWLQRMLPNARTVFRSNSREVQGRMCELGAGLAVLPRPLGDHLAGVERIELAEEPPQRETWVGYHRDLRGLTRLRALLEHVVARLAD